jgi:hypothetical protein
MSNNAPDVAAQVAELAKRNKFAAFALQFASLLPTGAISWPWLRELVSIRNVHLRLGTQGWEEVRAALEQSRPAGGRQPAGDGVARRWGRPARAGND